GQPAGDPLHPHAAGRGAEVPGVPARTRAGLVTALPARVRQAAGRRMMEAILLVLCLILAFRAPGFRTTANLLAILRAVSLQGLIAFGMTLVIVVGEIDLSVGAVVNFAGCLIAY